MLNTHTLPGCSGKQDQDTRARGSSVGMSPVPTHGTWIRASGLRAGDLCFQKLTVCLNLGHDGTDGNRTERTQERSEMKGHPEPPLIDILEREIR